jgi:hypothetical protein
VWEAIERNPRRSARRHDTSLVLSEPRVRRVLHKDLHFHSYKTLITLAIDEHDYENKSWFLLDVSQLITHNQDVVNYLLMRDEPHMYLSELVNKQIFRYWSATNPQKFMSGHFTFPKSQIWYA